MKKLLTLILITLVLSCANTDRDTYTIETTLLNGTIDTVNVLIAYNKDLRKFEEDVVNSSMFNEQSINSAYQLIEQHPLGIFYKDTLEKEKPSIIAFSKTAKNYENPLGAKLINNSIVFNRSLVVSTNEGNIKSFRVLSITGQDVKKHNIDYKLLAFINSLSVTAEELDAVPYVSLKAANRIIESRPINSAFELNKVPYVSDESVTRLRIYAQTWVKPNN